MEEYGRYAGSSRGAMNRSRSAQTVSQVNRYVKSMFANDFLLKHISVKGEVSNCKYHTAGHIYFTLKDSGGSLNCVMFAGSRSGLAFRMENGQQVIVTGAVDVYERDGKYQLYARQIEQDGLGSLYERFLLLKNELEEMGMFSGEYKKPIPPFAMRIGIVTAPTGAAIRDIESIAHRRNPYVQLILCPALVQGDGAAESICHGIQRLEQANVDLIIIGRGGGSIEDLWAFNERIVAEAIFSCSIPIISAVGHETDTTIADYAADLRAPTPSAAAELAVWEYEAFQQNLQKYEDRLEQALRVRLLHCRQQLSEREKRLQKNSPESRLREMQYRQIQYADHIREMMERKLQTARNRFLLASERLNGLSPLKKLESGYTFTQTSSGEALTRVEQVQEEDLLTVYVTNGKILTRVREIIRTEE